MKARAQSAGAMGHTARPPAPRPVSPGQPENALPRWYHLPLDAKIPLPRVVPKGKAIMYPAKVGEPLWRTVSASLGTDLNDPLLMQLPAPHEYNPLHDPFSSGHLRRPDLQDAIYRHGLVTRHGFGLSSLKNFNRFREYLHSVNLRHVKHKRTEVEKPLRSEYEHLALDVVREARRREEEEQPETAAEGGTSLSARYSDVMRDEESKLPDYLPDFYSLLTDKEKLELNEENKTFATIRFAKIQNRESRLAAIKSWLRKDGRKAALLRLRRLQIMEERRKKGINNWKTRTAVQSEFFEELRTRERREAEARRAHLDEKKRYQSAIGVVHDVKYDEVVQKWREKRLRSAAGLFCGYAEDFEKTFIEPESNNEEEFADAENQTDLRDDIAFDKEQTILIDRSTGLIEDITDGFNADEVREYETAAKQLVESALFVHSEILIPATSRYKAELERESKAELDRGHNAAVQTTDSLQQMDPIPYRPDMVRGPESSTDVLQQEDGGSKDETIGYPFNVDGLTVPGDDTVSRGHSSAASSSYRAEVVFSMVENEVLRVEKDNDHEPTDKVELLVVALDALEKVVDGSEDDCVDGHAGAIQRLLMGGREVLAQAIDMRRDSSLVVEEIVRLAIDDIAQHLQETTTTTPDGSRRMTTEAENLPSSAGQRRGRGRRRGGGGGGRGRRQSKASSCRCGARADLLTYIVGKAVAMANRSTEEARCDADRSREGQSEVKDDDDGEEEDFTETFLRFISGGEKGETTTHRSSALVSACDDFNDTLCDIYARMDLSEREFIQLAKDKTTNEANRLVTSSVKKVLEDLGGEGLEMNDTVSNVEATRAIAEALLNLALHRDLEQITKEYKDPHQLIDLVARIVKTHGSVRDSAACAFRSAVGEHTPWTRWHLASILLNRLITAALDRATAEQGTCEMTDEILISLAAAVNVRGLASKVVLQPKKGRMRRRCPRQPPVIDQTKFRRAMADGFSDQMKQLVDLAVLPEACVNHALSQAIQLAAPTSSLVTTSPKRQQTTALLADVKSIVADAARVVLRKTVGDLAAKLRATNDIQVECVLGQIENALTDIDTYGLLSNESQLGLRARNSIELSRERLKEISPSTHWSVAEHSASDEEVNDRVTRKMSISSKVVRLDLVPTDPNLIHEPHLSTSESVDQSLIPPAAPAAIKAPQLSTAVDDLVEELNVMPMFGNVPVDIDPDLVTEDLLVLSIKRDEDLDSPKLSMRNSFRNVHRPDVSSIGRFSSSSSSVTGPESIHDRVKGVFTQRRSTMEEELPRNILRSDEESEYVISKVNIPGTDSVPEFWPTEPGQSTDEAPIQSTVTTEYSKEYSFPEDNVMPPVSGTEEPIFRSEKAPDEISDEDMTPLSGSEEPIFRPERAPDEISMISYLYGDPQEFHHLKISSLIGDYEESTELIPEGQADDAPKKRDPAVPPLPRNVESDGKSVPVEESEEVVIASREVSGTIDFNRDVSEQFLSHESSKKRINGADGISEEKLATNDMHVTLKLEAAATELLKHDSSVDTSSRRRLDTSTDSMVLPPVPTNSHDSGQGGFTADT